MDGRGDHVTVRMLVVKGRKVMSSCREWFG